MSRENVEGFYVIVQNNAKMQEQLESTKDITKFKELAVELGRENGYTFTVEEVGAFLDERSAQGNAELSNRELEAVAGGKGRSCPSDTRFTFCVFISSCWGSKC
jgi:predicted ribosomally synthesized peptide with nif11-like leader